MSLSTLLRLPANLVGGRPEGGTPRRQSGTSPAAGSSEPGGDALEGLIAQGRYCRVLTAEHQSPISDSVLASAWKALEEAMALVPAGTVHLDSRQGTTNDPPAAGSVPLVDGQQRCDDRSVAVGSLYVDRYAVTNADFARFIAAGGYSQMELWPPEIWPNVLQFVDRSGHPGPRSWSRGRAPRRLANHPVVGVCWYEANAYARWMGKRLPKSAEWERAASWSSGLDGHGGHLRYPWGNAFDPARANIWVGGPGTTVPVGEYYNGCTPNGVYQLIGNVWEWTATRYQWAAGRERVEAECDQPLGEIRGGAFDTYFESQATCRFRTGQPLLFRGRNVGFRCCVSAEDLRRPPDPAAFLPPSGQT